MRYYSVIIRLFNENEKAVIVKATDINDARRITGNWRGLVMNIVEVIPPNAYLKAVTGKVA